MLFRSRTYTCSRNNCEKKLPGWLKIVLIILFIYIYTQLHPYIMEIFGKIKKPKSKCPKCNVVIREGKDFCHKCGKSIKYKKVIKDLSHLFKEEKKSRKKKK